MNRFPVAARYRPNVEFFSYCHVPPLSGYDFQTRLRQARVTIIGIGGLGSFVAMALRRLRWHRRGHGRGTRTLGAGGGVMTVTTPRQRAAAQRPTAGRPTTEQPAGERPPSEIPATRPPATVVLQPLHIGEIEDGAAEVGRPETGVFVSLPVQGIDIIRDLQRGLALAQVSERFARRYGAPPDLDDFVAALTECGFVRHTGAQPDGERSELAQPAAGTPAPQIRGWRLLASLPPARVAWLVSRPALAGWAVVWLAVPLMLAARPDPVPTATDARLGLGVALDATLLTVLGWDLVLVHEIAHLVAVRASG